MGVSDYVLKVIADDNRFPPHSISATSHGNWIYIADSNVTKCSCCGWSSEGNLSNNYCRLCGAKMEISGE